MNEDTSRQSVNNSGAVELIKSKEMNPSENCDRCSKPLGGSRYSIGQWIVCYSCKREIEEELDSS